jgi:hypothetical protein
MQGMVRARPEWAKPGHTPQPFRRTCEAAAVCSSSCLKEGASTMPNASILWEPPNRRFKPMPAAVQEVVDAVGTQTNQDQRQRSLPCRGTLIANYEKVAA